MSRTPDATNIGYFPVMDSINVHFFAHEVVSYTKEWFAIIHLLLSSLHDISGFFFF